MRAWHYSRNSTLTERRKKKKIKENGYRAREWENTYSAWVGGNNTRAIVETLKTDDFTEEWMPFFLLFLIITKPSQEGIYQHYKAISEATDLPIVLYNVPGHTGVNMKARNNLAHRTRL